jgi:hypothetical protein
MEFALLLIQYQVFSVTEIVITILLVYRRLDDNSYGVMANNHSKRLLAIRLKFTQVLPSRSIFG